MKKVFDKKEYNKNYDKEHYTKFAAKLKKEELEELNNFLKKRNMNKREFVLQSKELLERRNNMKIENLWILNALKEMASNCLNRNVDSEFYDFYFENNIEWLINNSKKIINDFYQLNHDFEKKNNIFQFALKWDRNTIEEAIDELKGE